MCNRCSNKFNPLQFNQLTQQQAYLNNTQNVQTAQTAYMILGGASMMLNLIFGGFAFTNSVSSYSNTTTSTSLSEKYSNGSSSVENTEEVKETPEQSSTEIEKEVKDILAKNNITVSDSNLQAIIKKYPTMKTIQTGGLSVEQRVINYAKGLEGSQRFENIATGAVNNTSNLETIQLDSVKQAMDKGSQTDFNNAYLQYAQEQIEVYDTDNDGQISYEEFSAEEKANAGDLYNENGTKAVFNTIDQNNDNSIDKTEMASMIWAISKINDGNDKKSANDITPDEIETVTNALSTIGLEADLDNIPEEELEGIAEMIRAGIPDKQLLIAALKNGYEGFKASK